MPRPTVMQLRALIDDWLISATAAAKKAQQDEAPKRHKADEARGREKALRQAARGLLALIDGAPDPQRPRRVTLAAAQRRTRRLTLAEARGRLVRSRRMALELSVCRLAKRAGLSEGTLKNIERGSHSMREDTAHLLAPALGLPCGALCGEAVALHAELVRVHLQQGPATADALMAAVGIDDVELAAALAELERRGCLSTPPTGAVVPRGRRRVYALAEVSHA